MAKAPTPAPKPPKPTSAPAPASREQAVDTAMSRMSQQIQEMDNNALRNTDYLLGQNFKRDQQAMQDMAASNRMTMSWQSGLEQSNAASTLKNQMELNKQLKQLDTQAGAPERTISASVTTQTGSSGYGQPFRMPPTASSERPRIQQQQSDVGYSLRRPRGGSGSASSFLSRYLSVNGNVDGNY